MKNIPVLTVTGKTLAVAYEEALMELYRMGCRFKTQYDKPDDPASIDATMNITIEEPMTDPMIHKAFPGSIADLREYVMELQGAKDHWIKRLDDPNDTRWEYTYHGRFKHWGEFKNKKHMGIRGHVEEYFGRDGYPAGEHNIDQIEAVIAKLVKQPFTRSAQIVTWMPNLDLYAYDCPCLQSLWYRIAEDNGEYYLNCNGRIRSNDSWNAAMMNLFGLTMFNREVIADEIQKRSGKKVHLARMNWQADSWHIYGKDIQQAKDRLFNRILNTEFADRIYNFNDPDIQEMYYESDEVIRTKIRDTTEDFAKTYDK